MPNRIVMLLLCGLFAACSAPPPPPAEKTPRVNVLDTQLKALDKAKAVQGAADAHAADTERAIDDAGG